MYDGGIFRARICLNWVRGSNLGSQTEFLGSSCLFVSLIS